MSLLTLLVVALVFLLVLWLIQRYVVPAFPAPWGNVILAVVAILMVVSLLNAIGLLPSLNQPIGR